MINQYLLITQIPSPPPDVDYPLDGGKILKLPGKIRYV